MVRNPAQNNQIITNQIEPLAAASAPAQTSSNMNVTSTEYVHSPFLLHNADHPGLILVSHTLTGPNYNTWSRAMIMALNAKNKLGFVDGSIPMPHSTDPLVVVWSRCNSMVSYWILNAVTKEIADSLLYLNTA